MTGAGSPAVGRRTFLTATGSLGVAAALGGVGRADGSAGRTTLLVGYSTVTGAEAVRESLPGSVEAVGGDEALGFLAVELPAASTYDRVRTAARIAEVDGVRYVERDAELQAHGGADRRVGGSSPDSDGDAGTAPNDPKFSGQYAPQQVNAPAAWRRVTGTSEVTVAVVDQGVKYDHPDLKAQFGSTKGKDFASGDGDPYPDDMHDEYHGTHVAGIAAATTGNGTGVAGISDATLLSCRALDESGSGNTSDIAAAVRWATDQGADVVNMSLGGGGRKQTMKRAVQYAVRNGTLPVCSAGNDGSEGVSYPARYTECVAVGAIDENEDRVGFSQYGEHLDVMAPGSSVLSCWTQEDKPYDRISGTSMASPVAAGVVALAKAAKPHLTPDQLRALLEGTAVDLGLPGKRQGAGRVDAEKAVTADVGNFAPSAAFSVDVDNPDPGQSVRFDAAAASDPEESIAAYEWAFGDGTTATGESVTHTYDSAGDYDATLTVRDAAGKTDSVTKPQHVVGNEPPHASIAPPNPSAKAGEEIYFRGRYSEDDDGSIDSHEWEFGDGTTATGGYVHHTYDAPGEYEVTLTVTDDDGATDTATVTATVTGNQSPQAAFSVEPTNPTPEKLVTVDAGDSTDPDGEIQSYEWEFGDGTTDTGDREQHVYDSPGEYTISLIVTDDTGATDTATRQVRVVPADNQPPSAAAEASVGTTTPGTTVSFDASGSSDPDGSIDGYEWDFGDGSTATGETVDHAFAAAGTYPVELTVTDDGGATDTATVTVTVERSGDGGNGNDRECRTTASRTETGSLSTSEDGRTYTHSVSTGDPCGAVVSLSGPTGADLDLYLTLDGREPTVRDYDRRSWNYGSDERIELGAEDLSGDASLGILVDRYSGAGEFELSVEVTGKGDRDGGGGDGGDGGGDDGGDGGSGDCGMHRTLDSMTGSLSGGTDRARFEYSTRMSGDSRTPCRTVVELSGPDGADFDLYLTTDGSPASDYHYDRKSTSGNSEERIAIDDPDPDQTFGVAVESWSGSGDFEVTVEELGK